jgi:hypothetical protein
VNPPPGDPFIPLALEIHDALMVIAPRGWQSVRLCLARRADGSPRVAELSTTLGPAGSRPKPDLGVQAGAFHGVLNEALADLERAARDAGIPWSAITLVATRESPERARLELRDDADATVHAVTLDAPVLAHAMFSEALFDLIETTLPEADRRQESLLADIAGHDEWNYDQSTTTLTLSKGVLPWRSYRAEIVGTWAEPSETWLWAWANRSLAPSSRRAVETVRDTLRATAGLSAFARPSFPCDERFASLLALVAAARMDARGVYPASYGEGVAYLAVLG